MYIYVEFVKIDEGNKSYINLYFIEIEERKKMYILLILYFGNLVYLKMFLKYGFKLMI